MDGQKNELNKNEENPSIANLSAELHKPTRKLITSSIDPDAQMTTQPKPLENQSSPTQSIPEFQTTSRVSETRSDLAVPSPSVTSAQVKFTQSELVTPEKPLKTVGIAENAPPNEQPIDSRPKTVRDNDFAPSALMTPKASALPSTLLDAFNSTPIKEPQSLNIPPLRQDYSDSYLNSRSAQEIALPRISETEHQLTSQSGQARITLGEFAARLNQGDSQKSVSAPPASESTIPARDAIAQPPVQSPVNFIPSDTQKTAASFDWTKPVDISQPIEQGPRREVPLANSVAQPIQQSVERLTPANPPPMLQGQISNNRDNSLTPNRTEAPASDKPMTIADARARVEPSPTDRAPKVDVSKIETVDARSSKIRGAASSGSDAIKSNRPETISTDKISKPDKADRPDATKTHEETKGGSAIWNQSRREPLIIPGVITGRASDNAKGGKDTKADVKPDKNADVKAGDGTKSDGKLNVGKNDRADGKTELHPEGKAAATTANVVHDVTGRIVDGLATIKDKLIPGIKPGDSRGDKNEPHPEFINHAAQPKSNDANLGISRDLKSQTPALNSGEFVYNGKKPLSESREDTLSNKAGGLKQALEHIFGNHPDVAADLKANAFPGPKTVPLEKDQTKPNEKLPPRSAEVSGKRSEDTTRRIADPGYLRNQDGDKIPTGNLRDELAELRANAEHPDDSLGSDLKNKQQIKDFTVQLGEIAKATASMPNSEFFAGHQSSLQIDESQSDDEDYDTRYLYYVKDGDTLRSIFDNQLPHEVGNIPAFELFVKTNEQTVRLASMLSADGMTFTLRVGTILKLPTPKQIARLKLL